MLGSHGSYGGALTINASGDSITQDLEADEISSITVYTADGASVTGSTSGSVTVEELRHT